MLIDEIENGKPRQTILSFPDSGLPDVEFGIKSGSSRLSRILNSGEYLEFGQCNAAAFECTVSKLSDVKGQKICVNQKIGEYTVPLFAGYVDSSIECNARSARKIVAYDALYFYNNTNVKKYIDLAWAKSDKISIKELRTGLMTYMGIEQEETELICDDLKISKIQGEMIAFGTLIKCICEINVVFGQIDAHGTFRYIKLGTNIARAITYRSGDSTFENYMTKEIDAVRTVLDTDTVIKSGGGENIYTLSNNNLVQSMDTDTVELALNRMLTNLKGISYRPCSIVPVKCDPTIGVGEKISFNVNGVESTTYVLSITLSNTQMIMQDIIADGNEYCCDVSTDAMSMIAGALNKSSGKSAFLHIKYSNDGLTFTDNKGETPGDWIGTYSDHTETDSAIFDDYSWIKIKGEDGQDGISGTSVSSITEEYYLSTSNTSLSGGAWQASPPTWTSGKYMWTRSKIVYANPPSTEYTSPVCDNSWEALGTANDAKNEIDTVEKKVMTNIEKTNESIELLATKEEVTTKFNAYSTTSQMNAAIEAKANSITNTVATTYTTKQELNNLQIGGRNLLRDTHKTEVSYVYPSSGYKDYFLQTTTVPLNGDTYTLSFWAKSTVDGDVVRVHLYNPSNVISGKGSQGQYITAKDGLCDFKLSTMLTKYWVTYTIPKNGNATRRVITSRLIQTYGSGTVTFKWEKLEEGAKATDWTPAPEDVDGRIESSETKISTLEQTAEGLTFRVDTQLSGRNLIRNSKGNSCTNWLLPGVVEPDTGFGNVIKLSTTATSECCLAPPRTEVVEQSTQYTFSGYIWVDSNVSSVDMFWLSDTLNSKQSGSGFKNNTVFLQQKHFTPNTWHHFAYTFTTKSDDYTGYIRIDNNGTTTSGTAASLWVTRLKLEKGDVSTYWTPAPEDVDADASRNATNYLDFSSNGLAIGDMTTNSLARNILIGSDSIDIRNGLTVLASYGEMTTIGKAGGKHILINDSALNIMNGSKVLASFGSDAKINNGTLTGAFGEFTRGFKVQSPLIDGSDLGFYIQTYNNGIKMGLDALNISFTDPYPNANSILLQTDGILINSNRNNLTLLCKDLYIKFSGFGSNIMYIEDGTIGLSNNKPIYMQDSGGTYRALANLNSSNNYSYAAGGVSNITYIGTKDYTNLIQLRCKNGVLPGDNGGTPLGNSSYRWKQLYAATSTISTSDRNSKKNIYDLDGKYIELFKKLIPVSFQFIDGTSGRTHIGFISQDVEEAMAAVGLTDIDFAGFCKDIKKDCVEDDDGNITENIVCDENGEPIYTYSLRYEEFIALNTKMIQLQEERISSLEERLSKIEKLLS